MDFRAGKSPADLWSEFIADEEDEFYRQPRKEEPQIAVVYRRRASENTRENVEDLLSRQSSSRSSKDTRPSLAPVKRISWNRSLSTRGRTSIAVAACADFHPQQRKPRKQNKPPLPKGKFVQPVNYEMERAYFQEVDSFELLEESPSPKKPGTWIMGFHSDKIVVPHLATVLQKWLSSKRWNQSGELSASLTKILETPELPSVPIPSTAFGTSKTITIEKESLLIHSAYKSVQRRRHSSFTNNDFVNGSASLPKMEDEIQMKREERAEDIDVAVGKLSLTSRPFFMDPFLALLTICGQSSSSTFLDVLSCYCDPDSILKIGEGTFGEAFKAGNIVCKIVPFDGDLRVNGEVQKRSEELLEEVLLSLTLNHLRGHDDQVNNACSTFINTMDIKICQGSYDAALVRAWEDWDRKHGSENDHPKDFSQKQCYVLFIQEHGGKDLESFVLLNFNEARTLLIQVTLSLAVAEAEYEFEHRDLHWGNILLSRKASSTLQYTLGGKQIFVKTFGLFISIIDFTLSRINTGEEILFLDLSLDPELFEGPKGDKQSETYRKMREVTEECWEGSFPKTNVLWLQYLVDILLLKKSYARSSKDERDSRSLKKRLNNYNSAQETVSDPFFSDLIVDDIL